jgi:hypothetical protein
MPYLRTLIGLPCEREAGAEIRTKTGKQIEAATLGEAIAEAEKILSARIVPHFALKYLLPLAGPRKYFRVYAPDCVKYRLVDIHVYRDKENICPKQNLSFPLLESDIVGIGGLVC